VWSGHMADSPLAAGGRPSAFDKEDCKGRNVIERDFSIFTQWRALATHHDKLALTYSGGADPRAASIWPRAGLPGFC
jgi:transposase